MVLFQVASRNLGRDNPSHADVPIVEYFLNRANGSFGGVVPNRPRNRVRWEVGPQAIQRPHAGVVPCLAPNGRGVFGCPYSGAYLRVMAPPWDCQRMASPARPSIEPIKSILSEDHLEGEKWGAGGKRRLACTIVGLMAKSP